MSNWLTKSISIGLIGVCVIALGGIMLSMPTACVAEDATCHFNLGSNGWVELPNFDLKQGDLVKVYIDDLQAGSAIKVEFEDMVDYNNDDVKKALTSQVAATGTPSDAQNFHPAENERPFATHRARLDELKIRVIHTTTETQKSSATDTTVDRDGKPTGSVTKTTEATKSKDTTTEISLPVYGRWVFSTSVGFVGVFGDNLIKREYAASGGALVENLPRDTVNLLYPSTLVHFFKTSSKDQKGAWTLGVVPGDHLTGLIGYGLMLGGDNHIVISGGLAVGQVDRISTVDPSTTRKVTATGAFLGVSYRFGTASAL